MKELLEKRAGLVQKQRALLDAAKGERRDLNEAEAREFEEAETEIRRLEALVEKEKTVQARERSLSQAVAPPYRPPAAASSPAGGDRPEKGIRLARAVRAIAAAQGDLRAAAYHAEHVFKDPHVAAALGESAGTTGGFAVPPEYSQEIIELLAAQAVVRRAGARVLPMNSNVLNIPRVTGGATSTYIGENQNIAKSEQTFGQLTLTAKKLATLVPISNDLIRDASPAADAIVRDDIVQSMALREDLGFIRDDGTQNKPRGIRYWTAAANVFSANATINAANVIADLGKAIRLVRASNAKMLRCAWIMSARTEFYLLTLLDANSNFIFRPEMLAGRLLGFPYFVSTQVPENLGSGTNETEVFFGDFADAVIGENESLVVDVSTEAAYYDGSSVVAAFSLDQTVIRAIARHDFALRHDTSFSVVTAVKWAA